MKTIILFLSVFCFQQFFAQKYLTKKGNIHFEASVPLFEDVDAKNSTAVTVFDTDNGGIASIAIVKNFKFSVALMEEHFNENYAESSKYPKATFSGIVEGFSKDQLSSSPKNHTISGTLNFHGVDHKVSSPAIIQLKDGVIHITGKFTTKPENHNIKIPKLVAGKIAETINVDYHFMLNKQ